MKEVFKTLNAIDVNGHTEKKNDLTYLSWAWAWAEIKKVYPDATYKIRHFEGKPYLYDESLGYMVMTEMTINGLTHEMWLPVMDGANKAMRDVPYKYTVKNKNFKYATLNMDDNKYYDRYGNEQPEYIEKTVEQATMFDINTAIMRCLVKNIAMFGLGLYIYAGEDLPEDITNALVNKVKVDALVTRCEKCGVPTDKICKLYKVGSLEELNEGNYSDINIRWQDIAVNALVERCEKDKVPTDKICKLYKVDSFSKLTETKFNNINVHWEDIKKA